MKSTQEIINQFNHKLRVQNYENILNQYQNEIVYHRMEKDAYEAILRKVDKRRRELHDEVDAREGVDRGYDSKYFDPLFDDLSFKRQTFEAKLSQAIGNLVKAESQRESVTNDFFTYIRNNG